METVYHFGGSKEFESIAAGGIHNQKIVIMYPFEHPMKLSTSSERFPSEKKLNSHNW
jgi:hypothetical protein